MLYTVYKTTNQINQKFYIGVHKTKNPNDAYLGSGKHLQQAIRKYGIENFVKEILFCFECAEEAFKMEAELVDPDNPHCYNIKRGGEGGFDYINKANLNNAGNNCKIGANRMRSVWEDEKRREVLIPVLKAAQRKSHQSPNRKKLSEEDHQRMTKKASEVWTGKHHGEDTKKRIAEKHRRESNPVYQMKWMYHDGLRISIRVPKEDLEAFSEKGWFLGRKMEYPYK